ncbi:MAG TPA: Lrp/AsnC family transcriptional regulator [Verrucomicrobiota bacterium]|nr:Lrp/AsnC family transcriptional regulator [Verrucomicrobiota bacterium]
MENLLKLLRDDPNLTVDELSRMLNIPKEMVEEKLKTLKQNGIVLGYRTILNEEKLGIDLVRALIEVKITPERGGGFDRLAERISKYDEVRSCYLMSGAYDLMVVVEGDNLKEVAKFVSEKLATIPGVISTATHFMLKPYKEQGILVKQEVDNERLPITP